MAKIHKPQDQNGIDLINQTVFDNEHALRVAEETYIEGKLDTEIERSTNKDKDLDDKINTEISRATTNESTISVILNDEIARASAEDTRIDTKLDAEIKKLEKKISNNEENISALGLDIDAINESINSIAEPKLEILTYTNSGPVLVDEIILDVLYTTDESGVTTPVDTFPDINILYQCTDGFIYTSNAVAYSPFINVVLSEENNQAETGENNISEGKPQHTATLKFSGLSGIKEDITRVIIFDAIVAGNSSNGYNKCKHISRIFPVHFRVAPSTPEES